MNYVDIVIIALVAFFALLGLWKGFGKTGVKLLCFALSILVTWLLADVVVGWVLGVPFLQKLVVGSGSISLYSAYYKALGEAVQSSVADGTEVGGALGLLVNPMIARYDALGGPIVYGLDYGQFVAVMLSINTLAIVACFVVYAIVRIVAHLVSWIIRKIFLSGDGPVRLWSRLVGFVLGAARGVAWVMVLLVVSAVILPFGFASTYEENIGNGVISGFAARYTYVAVEGALYGGDHTADLLEKAGFAPEHDGVPEHGDQEGDLGGEEGEGSATPAEGSETPGNTDTQSETEE